MTPLKSAVFFITLILCQHGSHAYCQKQDEGFWGTLTETVSKASEAVSKAVGDETIACGLKAVGLASAAVYATPVVLGYAGFTATGVSAGSLAAFIQTSWFGGSITGITGTAFATLQSIGAAGLGFVGKTVVGTASGAAVKAMGFCSGPTCGKDDRECKK